MEVIVKNQPIETFEKSLEKTEAKTFRGYLNGCILKAVNKNNKDMEILFREMLRMFNRFYPQQIIKNEITILDGWKGKDISEIYKGFDNDFRIAQHIKDKETGEIKQRVIEVSKTHINNMILIVKKLPFNQPIKCYYFAKQLGYNSWKDLWRERKEYFARYYFPIKVLEALSIISYSGKGAITKLK